MAEESTELSEYDLRTKQTVDDFTEIYTNFKLHFYREIFKNFSNREATLTTVESFCMEVIYAMGHPTINQFANFIQISSPNAAYKVNNLIKKGYLRKIQSQRDKREYYLEVTEKYIDYYNVSQSYVDKVLKKCRKVMTEEEWDQFDHSVRIIQQEQQRDLPIYKSEMKE